MTLADKKTKKHKFSGYMNLLMHKKQLVDKYKSYYESLSKREGEYLKLYKGIGYYKLNAFLRQPVKSIKPFGDFQYNPDHVVIGLRPEYKRDMLKVNTNTTLGKLVDYAYKYNVKANLDFITAMDNILKHKNCPHIKDIFESDIILYRGTSVSSRVYNKQRGATLEFGEYLSTSLDPVVALDFMLRSSDNSPTMDCVYPVLMILKNCKALPALFLDWELVSDYNFEGIKFTMDDEYEMMLPRNCKFRLVNKYKTTEYNHFIGNAALDKLNIHALSDYYNDIKQLNSSFMKLHDIKAVINAKLEIMVFELEFISYDPKPINLKKKYIDFGIILNSAGHKTDNYY